MIKNKYIIICLLLLCFQTVVKVSAQDVASLTQSQVRDYIRTEVLVGRLQMEMKANANRYDSLIQTFYKRRKVLLKEQGWKEQAFEEVQGRIMAAATAIRDFRASQKKKTNKTTPVNYDKRIAQMKANDVLPEKNKKEIIAKLRKAREQHAVQKMNRQLSLQKKKWYDRSRKDWPAVKPYLQELKQLTNWYNGNGAEPPEIK